MIREFDEIDKLEEVDKLVEVGKLAEVEVFEEDVGNTPAITII